MSFHEVISCSQALPHWVHWMHMCKAATGPQSSRGVFSEVMNHTSLFGNPMYLSGFMSCLGWRENCGARLFFKGCFGLLDPVKVIVSSYQSILDSFKFFLPLPLETLIGAQVQPLQHNCLIVHGEVEEGTGLLESKGQYLNENLCLKKLSLWWFDFLYYISSVIMDLSKIPQKSQ